MFLLEFLLVLMKLHIKSKKKDMINKLGYNMDEDIKKEMMDLIKRRCYAKKEKKQKKIRQ